MNPKAMYKLSYGLYLATTKLGDKVNGCIINTAVQVANSPTRVMISVNQANYTNDLLLEADTVVISAISTENTMATFQRFGFQSGRNVDKFDGLDLPTVDGIPYLRDGSCGYLVCKVLSRTDLGSHTLYITEVVDGDVLSDAPAMTYDYYQSNVKPKPQAAAQTTGYRCTVCNYVYEGADLPADFVCPLCKHGAEDFVKI